MKRLHQMHPVLGATALPPWRNSIKITTRSHPRRSAPRVLFLCTCALFAACTSAYPQTAAPLIDPAPMFAPGLYETESRNSALPSQPVKSRACVALASYDAFRDETMSQYRKSPQLMKNCRLSDTTTLKNGFTFQMQCAGTKTILTYEFEKDLVRSTIQVINEAAPKYSSSILTLMRRVGDCPGQETGKAP
jgi:hypothetical protein